MILWFCSFFELGLACCLVVLCWVKKNGSPHINTPFNALEYAHTHTQTYAFECTSDGVNP